MEACKAAEEEKRQAAFRKQDLADKVARLQSDLETQNDMDRSDWVSRRDELKKEIQAEVDRHLERRFSSRGNILKKAKQVIDWTKDLDIGDPEL